ncbi:CDP-archaeol synthase [Candidatus Woesearchaeota archaeon]|nr:CDP-archaeol synthase [Candidatus Woesearchaeota archaeon]
MVWLLILKSLYFFLPAYVANMAPVLFRWIPWLNKPVHERLLGGHKTWRGIVVATIMGAIVFALQKYAYAVGFDKIALIDYNNFSWLMGALLGAGAILGDAVESYYKRKAGIPPGHSWMPWDQLDFVIGGVLLGMILYVPPAEVVLVLLVASPVLHIATNYIGYLIGVNEKKY